MMKIQCRRLDGSFVVLLNNLPYHVTHDDPLFNLAMEIGADAPFEQPIEVIPVSADEIRADRNRRLAATDWTQVADAPVDAAAWANYRQMLRDIPQQAGFPASVTWPELPNSQE